jgi:hypothetical protein
MQGGVEWGRLGWVGVACSVLCSAVCIWCAGCEAFGWCVPHPSGSLDLGCVHSLSVHAQADRQAGRQAGSDGVGWHGVGVRVWGKIMSASRKRGRGLSAVFRGFVGVVRSQPYALCVCVNIVPEWSDGDIRALRLCACLPACTFMHLLQDVKWPNVLGGRHCDG